MRHFGPMAWVFCALTLFGCSDNSGADSQQGNIADVPNTDVEAEVIGNCWLYATASWIESMHLAATEEPIDISESYWTYFHFLAQVRDPATTKLDPAGNDEDAQRIIGERGLMLEPYFSAGEETYEAAYIQEEALNDINRALAEGRLSTNESRHDALLVRDVLDDAFQLPAATRARLTKAFGKDLSRTFHDNAVSGSRVTSATELTVSYTEASSGAGPVTKVTTLSEAFSDWYTRSFPKNGSPSAKRSFLVRVQKALHDRQPVVINWKVDFNGSVDGKFQLSALKKAKRPGDQGDHSSVLEDYQVKTAEYGLLQAGVTLDPSVESDKAKLEAALLPSSIVQFLRTKNSWGSSEPVISGGATGFDDLYLDYLFGPIPWCPNKAEKTKANCAGRAIPFDSVLLPPGY